MQSFYDEVSIARKKFEIYFKLIYTISWNKVSISLFRLVITHYSAMQIAGAGA